MTFGQYAIFTILALTLALFLWGRFRHDVVALAALIAAVMAGVVPGEDAFAGFGHPAVITVACVLILSQGLRTTGAVDALARMIMPRASGRLVSMMILLGLGALLSGFMNNVGAMALLMPLAVQLAGRLDLQPGQVLMPLAFGTILGGMTTLVGTPPNLIVSGFRAEAGMGQFAMFAFAPVGASVAVIGVVLIVLAGWRLVPPRKAATGEQFETGAYLTEIRVPEDSKAVGLTLRGFEQAVSDSGAQIVALARNEVRLTAPHGGRRIKAGDLLVLEADVGALAETLSAFDIRLETDDPETEGTKEEGSGAKDAPEDAASGSVDEIVLREMVVLPDSRLIDRSSESEHLRTRFGVNLLAVSREGWKPRRRLRAMPLRAGDLLLIQGPTEALAEFGNETGCVPLRERDLRIPDNRMALLASAILLGAIALATFRVLPAAVAFALGVVVSMVVRTVPPRKVYTAIDWPVVVLLAALIPIAGAMQETGTADLLARFLVDTIAQGNAIAALVVILVTTMFLSDVMNNAATAAVMCPIALGIADALAVNADSFLMAVAIGASCAFLTPIGHQNNTLILGPGGFGFGDYWRLGLPLEILVVAVSVPMLLLVWQL